MTEDEAIRYRIGSEYDPEIIENLKDQIIYAINDAIWSNEENIIIIKINTQN